MRVACLLLLALVCVAEAGTTRRVYVAADEVEWDYAPKGDYYEVDEELEYRVDAPTFLQQAADRIGQVYTKAIYREYTDATFSTLAPRARDMEHLGILGPTVWAEVGDFIEFHFRNHARFNFSVHPHGVFYTKDAEGAKYPDNALPAGDSIPPGQTYTYVWPVPARAGPGPGDRSSRLWLYHGHVDEVIATNVALIGCMVVTSKGKAYPNGRPKDVDREIFLVANIFNENTSPYLDINMQKFLSNDTDFDELKGDEDFEESNLLHGLNGFVYDNVPGLFMDQGDRVRWYIGGLGTEVDLHTFSWHGNTVADHGMRSAAVRIIASETNEVDMIPDRVGEWILHCVVNDHIAAGMEAVYNVRAKGLYESVNYETLSDELYGGDPDDDDDEHNLVAPSSSASAVSAQMAYSTLGAIALMLALAV